MPVGDVVEVVGNLANIETHALAAVARREQRSDKENHTNLIP